MHESTFDSKNSYNNNNNKWKKGEGREEEKTSLLSPRSSFLFLLSS